MPDELDRLCSAYQQWSDTKGGSIETWLDLMGEEVAFESLAQGDPRVAFTAPRTGPEGVRSYLSTLVEEWQMLFFEVDEYIVDGSTIVALIHCEFENRATGKTARTRKADVWKFRDGRAVSFFEYYDTANIYAAAEPG